MVAFSSNRQKGNGAIDNIMKMFTVNKYGNERHGRSLDPNHFMEGYRYLGPYTELQTREQMHDNQPLNKLDEAAKEHDYAYLREKEEYAKDRDKNKHIRNIWNADDRFIAKAKSQIDDPIMGMVSSKLINAKENLEKEGLMDTSKFSGFGNDRLLD